MVPEMRTDFEVNYLLAGPFLSPKYIADYSFHLQGGIITVRPEDAKDMFYQDLDDKTVARLSADLRPQSFASFWSTTTYAAWILSPLSLRTTMDQLAALFSMSLDRRCACRPTLNATTIISHELAISESRFVEIAATAAGNRPVHIPSIRPGSLSRPGSCSIRLRFRG